MNAVTSTEALAGSGGLVRGITTGLRESVRGGLRFRTLLFILTVFWIYVVLSNVLYATSMQASFAHMAPGRFFANWDARVLQHVFLYPVLVVCVFTSLRVGWSPMWRAFPVQLLLGLFFSALATPALVWGEMLTSTESWHHEKVHSFSEFLSG